MYPLNLKLLSNKGQFLDEVNSTFSIRNIRLVEQEDETGKGFKFQVNGIEVFAKGANYIPLDFFTPVLIHPIIVMRYMMLLKQT